MTGSKRPMTTSIKFSVFGDAAAWSTVTRETAWGIILGYRQSDSPKNPRETVTAFQRSGAPSSRLRRLQKIMKNPKPSRRATACFENQIIDPQHQISHRKIEDEQSAPETGVPVVNLLFCFEPQDFHKDQKQAQSDGERGPEDMKHGRESKLDSGQQYMFHHRYHRI